VAVKLKLQYALPFAVTYKAQFELHVTGLSAVLKNGQNCSDIIITSFKEIIAQKLKYVKINRRKIFHGRNKNYG